MYVTSGLCFATPTNVKLYGVAIKGNFVLKFNIKQIMYEVSLEMFIECMFTKDFIFFYILLKSVN